MVCLLTKELSRLLKIKHCCSKLKKQVKPAKKYNVKIIKTMGLTSLLNLEKLRIAIQKLERQIEASKNITNRNWLEKELDNLKST